MYMVSPAKQRRCPLQARSRHVVRRCRDVQMHALVQDLRALDVRLCSIGSTELGAVDAPTGSRSPTSIAPCRRSERTARRFITNDDITIIALPSRGGVAMQFEPPARLRRIARRCPLLRDLDFAIGDCLRARHRAA
jgi:hypothetical protein